MIGFILGIFLVLRSSSLMSAPYLIGCALVAIFCLTLNIKLRWVKGIYLKSLIGALLGVAVASIHGHYQLTLLFDDVKHSRICILEGQVLDLPEMKGNYITFLFSVDSAVCGDETVDLVKVQLNYYFPEKRLYGGERYQLKVKLRRPRGVISPAAFDFTQWALARKINAVGYVKAILSSTKNNADAKTMREQFRQWIVSKNISEQAKGALLALILGDKQGIGRENWELLKGTGTLHLMVVSGLHIAIVVTIGWWLAIVIKSFVLFMQPKWVLAWFPVSVSLGLSLSYLYIAGAGISTQRAWLMAAIMLGAPLLKVHVSLWHRWWLAMLVVISLQPMSLLQPGFWLSFIAVAGLITLQGYKKTGYQKAGLLLHSQYVIWVVLFPLLLFGFQQVSMISPIVNVFAIFFISVLLMLLPICLIFSYIGIGLPLQYLAASIDQFWLGLAWLSQKLPFTVFHSMVIDSQWLILLILMALILVVPLPIRVKVVATLCGLIIVFPPKKVLIPHGEFKLIIFDVGQGLSLLIETRHHQILFDTGAAFESGFNYFDAVTAPYLKQQRVDELDLLVLSHADNDHAGGVQAVLNRVKVARIETGAVKALGYAHCNSGRYWQWDGVEFKYRHPIESDLHKSNNKSCVLEFRVNQCRVLIMADMERALENQLMKSLSKSAENVLIVGHHGSNTSTTTELLVRENIDYAVISAGYQNRYNHPHPKVLNRLRDEKIKVYRTDKSGSVFVEPSSKGCQMTRFREEYQRFWLTD